MPVVLINTPQGDQRDASVLVDNFGGAGELVRHLVKCGHRRIAFIAGPEGNFDARERLRGFRTTLAALRPGAECQIVAGDFTEESGYQAGKQIAAMSTRPDAVFAANDSMAIGCLFALREAGLNVPADIALAGFDDIPIARFVNPPLTTVRVRIAELGELALRRLVHAIGHPDHRAEPAHVVPCELVVRESCCDSTAAATAAEGGHRQG
jgi:LacI family transcriptional regulator